MDAIATWTPKDVHVVLSVTHDGDWAVARAATRNGLGYSTGADAFFVPAKATPSYEVETMMMWLLVLATATLLVWSFRQYCDVVVKCQYCKSTVTGESCSHCGAPSCQIAE